jgi:2-polyprenyl-3-methyl-5-hydroxy-6-metoxy-1,4-benzoquinol methylase
LFDLLLKNRSKEKELLDLGTAFYSPEEYVDCQKILFKINRLLGFFSYTTRFIKKLQPVGSILDVGCGGGLVALNLGASFPSIQFEGCDISAEAIAMAEKESKNNPQHNVAFTQQSEVKLDRPENSVDLVIATLVCHHIDDEDLVRFFQDALSISRSAVLINDLHRHRLPYLFYQLFSPIFGNRLINHDGLISIKRGFTRKEWYRLLKQAGIKHFSVRWRFPFCWSVILWKN